MNNQEKNRNLRSYELKSELARFSLPAANRDPSLKLAWVNSVCILFLLIGILGARRGMIAIKPAPPLEDIVPVVVEPVILPPQETTKKKQTEENKNDSPHIAVVVPQSPNFSFSVPTIGSLVVPASMNAVPPLESLRAEAAINSVSSTGEGGQRPQPSYPRMALEEGEQGTMLLVLSGDAAGNVISVDVKEPSGFPILDHATADFIKRRWHLPVGADNQLFQTRITYKLKLN